MVALSDPNMGIEKHTNKSLLDAFGYVGMTKDSSSDNGVITVHRESASHAAWPVSYTHLTLPTNREV